MEKGRKWQGHAAPIADVDRGWAWVIAVTSFLSHFITLGFAYGIGTFYVEFLRAFGESKAKTAWITSLNYCLLCGLGPVASFLCQKFGCRFTLALGGLVSSLGLFCSAFAGDVNVLLVTMGFITGIGFCLSHQPAVVVNALYFVKYRTIILGLTFSGAGFGTVVYPWICRICIEAFGWRGALIMCAGLNLHIVALAMFIPRYSPLEKSANLVKKQLESETLTQQTNRFTEHFHLFNNVYFVLLCFNNFFFQFGMYIVYTHIAAYAHSLNFGDYIADMLISIVGISNLAGRAGFGIIGQQSCVDVPVLYCVAYYACGISIMGCGFWTSVVGLCTCAGLFGFLNGACGPLMCEVCCSVVGAKYFNQGYGFMMIFMAFGNLIGPPVAGLVYDLSKYYPASFYLGGICLFLSATVVIPSVVHIRRRKKEAKYDLAKDEEDVMIT